MTTMPKLLTLTDAAAERARAMIAARSEATQGLRIALKTGGCSGMAYDVEYADEVRPTDEMIEDQGVKVFIDPAAILFLAGSQIDWEEDILHARFTFQNPNEVARCGCGESVSFGGAGPSARS